MVDINLQKRSNGVLSLSYQIAAQTRTAIVLFLSGRTNYIISE